VACRPDRYAWAAVVNSISRFDGTWVPLIDTSGSTIALVNAANLNSAPVTTYTYDPTGTPSVSGTSNYWPFQYQGMEKEPDDPSTYYYTGSGQFYSPQLVRSLSEVGQTSSQGSGGAPPNQVPYGPGSEGNGSFGHWYVDNVLNQPNLQGLPEVPVPVGEGFDWIPVFQIAQDIEELVSFFEWLFGGSGAPPTPRQLLHGRHPLYPVILGLSDGLDPNEVSAGPTRYPSITRPLATEKVPEMYMGSVTLAAYIIPVAADGVPLHQDRIDQLLPRIQKEFPKGTPLSPEVRMKIWLIFAQFEEPNQAAGDAEYAIDQLEEMGWFAPYP